jgi:hypothetical protein
MMRQSGKTHPAVFVLALALGAVYLALRYRVMPVIALVLAAVGVYAFFAGARMITTRKASVSGSAGSGVNAHLEYHTGFSAQIWGVLFILFGAIIVALAYGLWRPNEMSDALRQGLATPLGSGLGMFAVGAMIAMWAGTRLIAGKAAFVETREPLASRAAAGVFYAFVGLALMTVGVIRIVAPELLTASGQWLGDLVKERAASR